MPQTNERRVHIAVDPTLDTAGPHPTSAEAGVNEKAEPSRPEGPQPSHPEKAGATGTEEPGTDRTENAADTPSAPAATKLEPHPRAAAAEPPVFDDWEIVWGPEADDGDWGAVFRALLTRLKACRPRPRR